LKKSDGKIVWVKHAAEVHNLIRGCLGWPGAYTHLDKKLLKIYKAAPALLGEFPPDPEPGQVISVSKERLLVACGKDAIAIQELQMEGKRSMKIREFLAGHKIATGQVLGQK
jgi:methionyl-tRNA formyltransferase